MNRLIPKLWLIMFVVSLLPLLGLAVDIIFNHLGSNPIEALEIRLGDWSLRFLWLTLAITPMQTVTGWKGLSPYRQLFGMYTFFYASLHVLCYLLVDHYFQWRIIGIDIVESSYIWFGVLAYLIIFLLAISTPKWAKKRLGKNWKKLHRLIYIAAVAAILHYFWQLKGNLADPLFYLIIIVLLLGFRVLVSYTKQQFTRLMIPKSRQ